MKKNKTMKRIVAGCLLVGLLSAIGIGAYLTDTDVKEDVYTVGNVQAEIVANGDMEVANAGYLLPNTIHTYERAATNTGINDAYVFMSITIPYEMVLVSDTDGTLLPQSVYQLFIPGSADGGYIGSEWKLVTAGFVGSQEIVANGQYCGEHDTHSAIPGDINNANNGYISDITYVYGYIGDNADGSLKALKSGETTSNLVDTMQLINLWGASHVHGEISTKLYAIQSNNINGGLTDVNGVWTVINKAIDTPMNYMIAVNEFHALIPAGTTSIEFVTGKTAPADAIDVSEAQDGSVMAWSEGTTFYVVSMNGNKITINDTTCMFDACEEMVSINLENFYPNSIGHSAFGMCVNLTSIKLPNSVTSIDEAAFCDCTSLTSITIPNSVTYIGDQAFSSCVSLKEINFEGTKEQWNAITFGYKWNELVPVDCVINFLGEEKVEVNLDEVLPAKYAGSYSLDKSQLDVWSDVPNSMIPGLCIDDTEYGVRVLFAHNTDTDEYEYFGHCSYDEFDPDDEETSDDGIVPASIDLENHVLIARLPAWYEEF